MLIKDTLEIIKNPHPRFYSCLFLVQKFSGGWRPVIDRYPLKEFVQQTPFKMETTSSVLKSVEKDDFMPSLDLKDTYFQAPFHKIFRKYLRVFLPRNSLPFESPQFWPFN